MNATPPTSEEIDRPRRGARTWLPTVVLAILLVAVVAIAALDLTVFRPAAASSSSTQGSVTVVDDSGRSVTVSGVPTRIIVLGPSVMDILFRLGLRADVVGVDGGPASAGGVLDDYSPGQVANWSLSSLPVITWDPTLDVEAVIALNPDLVVAGSGFSLSQLESLQSTYGIPCLYLNPPTLAGIEYDVSIVGAVTRTNATAVALNEQMEASMLSDANELVNITAVPSVFLTYYPDAGGYWTFGPGSFGNDLILDAGATSITENDTLANSEEVSGSYILAANPAAIIVGTGFGLEEQNYSLSPDWSSFGAVQAGHVIALNAIYLTEPDPSMIFGLANLITLLHPELSGGTPL